MVKSERRQVGGRYIARARGAFRRRDVRTRKPGVPTGPPEATRRDVDQTGANGAARNSLAALLAAFQGPDFGPARRG